MCQGHRCYFKIPPTIHLHVLFCENYTVCSVNVYITPLYVCTSHLCKVFTHSTLHTVHSGYPQHTTHCSRYLNTAHYTTHSPLHCVYCLHTAHYTLCLVFTNSTLHTVSSVYTQHTTHCLQCLHTAHSTVACILR